MDIDIDSARADLLAVRLGFKPNEKGREKYADEIWRRREEAKPSRTKSRWNWPIKSLNDQAVEERHVTERKNVIKFERYIENVAKKRLKKLAKRM